MEYTSNSTRQDGGVVSQQADHHEAAATTLPGTGEPTSQRASKFNSEFDSEFASESALFIRLLTICGGSCAQALVLHDLVQHHALMGAGALRVVSASEMVRLYPSALWNARSVARAVLDLEYRKLIEIVEGVRNTAKQYRLNDSVFMAKCANVSVNWLKGPRCEVV
jgi:hypothetical protein